MSIPRNSLGSATFSPFAGGCWMLTEGAAGMVSQVTGLARAVGLPVYKRDIHLRLPWRKMWPGLIPLWSGIFTTPLFDDGTIPPRLVISCGRQGAVGSMALKKWLGSDVFTVHIQDPRVSTSRFDLIVTPEHDGLHGPNVLHSLGAVHHINPSLLATARAAGLTPEMSGLGEDFVAVILGGPNRYYGYSNDDVSRLIQQLQTAVATQGCRLAIVPSRRTPAAVVDRFARSFARPHFVWQGTGQNPYLPALAFARHFVVTGDSVSMISEAAATGRPVSVFSLTERRTAKRFRRFHQSYEQAGITRPFDGSLPEWSYDSPDRTASIAHEIRRAIGLVEPTNNRAAA
ncbi:MAG: mitochondrial fission ELM1 family protein [Planctomycetaceae bacterium]